MDDLNNPQIRQDTLRQRLDLGVPFVVATLAQELGVSIDTVRRDLIALEQQGLVRRVRGGALPISAPYPAYTTRAAMPEPVIERLAHHAAQLVGNIGTVFLDGGTTMNAVAARLPEVFQGVVVTPAPSVALAALHNGKRVHLIGGALCSEGAMATGGDAERAAGAFAADLCLLGACGLWPSFGLSAEDPGEAGVKRAMALAAAKVIVVTSGQKLERRGRHRVVTLDEIDTLVTDASPNTCCPYVDAGIEVRYVT